MLLLALWLIAASEATVPAPTLPDVAAGCVCCSAEVEPAGEVVPREAWPQLREGDVLKQQTERVETQQSVEGGASAAGLLAYPPAQVWAVLTDFEAWPGFMPHVTSTRITRRDGQREWVAQAFRVLMTSMRHTTIYELDAARGRLRWRLDLEQAHDLADSSGSWELAPADGGRSTLLRYASHVDSGRRVPEFVQRMLFEHSIDALFENLRAELARRASRAR